MSKMTKQSDKSQESKRIIIPVRQTVFVVESDKSENSTNKETVKGDDNE